MGWCRCVRHAPRGASGRAACGAPPRRPAGGCCAHAIGPPRGIISPAARPRQAAAARAAQHRRCQQAGRPPQSCPSGWWRLRQAAAPAVAAMLCVCAGHTPQPRALLTAPLPRLTRIPRPLSTPSQPVLLHYPRGESDRLGPQLGPAAAVAVHACGAVRCCPPTSRGLPLPACAGSRGTGC